MLDRADTAPHLHKKYLKTSPCIVFSEEESEVHSSHIVSKESRTQFKYPKPQTCAPTHLATRLPKS